MSKIIYAWSYARIGEPMWLWPVYGEEQSVMFYVPEPPFSQSGMPPMTDRDWEVLAQQNARRTSQFARN